MSSKISEAILYAVQLHVGLLAVLCSFILIAEGYEKYYDDIPPLGYFIGFLVFLEAGLSLLFWW